MSALNYVIKPDIVIVSTDTLKTEGGVPVGFASKIFPLPHLHGVLCGTGSLDLILEWFVFVQTQAIALDMRHLDDIAPSRLPLIAEKYGTLHESTIYHFGLDARAGHLGGWAYRSTAGFSSERLLARSLGVKPPTPRMEPPNDPLIQLWLEENRLRG